MIPPSYSTRSYKGRGTLRLQLQFAISSFTPKSTDDHYPVIDTHPLHLSRHSHSRNYQASKQYIHAIIETSWSLLSSITNLDAHFQRLLHITRVVALLSRPIPNLAKTSSAMLIVHDKRAFNVSPTIHSLTSISWYIISFLNNTPPSATILFRPHNFLFKPQVCIPMTSLHTMNYTFLVHCSTCSMLTLLLSLLPLRDIRELARLKSVGNGI